MFAMTITPTAPSSHDRASSATARSGYSHGSEANQRIRSPWVRWASAMDAFESRAASLLTSSPPQYTFGHVSETTHTSTPHWSIVRRRRS